MEKPNFASRIVQICTKLWFSQRGALQVLSLNFLPKVNGKLPNTSKNRTQSKGQVHILVCSQKMMQKPHFWAVYFEFVPNSGSVNGVPCKYYHLISYQNGIESDPIHTRKKPNQKDKFISLFVARK